MKKFLLSVFVLGFGLFAYTQAYTLTDTDTKQLSSLQTALSSANNADLWNYYQQFAKLQKAVEGRDTRLSYLLTSLRDWSFTQITNRKNLLIQQAKTAKAEFLETYEGKLLLEDEVASNCIGRYNTLDNLSFVNNFPTPLTIAVRYRESTCSYALPKNGDGPFQIVSKDYGTGEITEELFLQTVQDFLDFSNTKINRYNEKNKAD